MMMIVCVESSSLKMIKKKMGTIKIFACKA